MNPFIISIVLFAMMPAKRETCGPDDIIGIWLMANKNVEVEVFKTENLFFGKVVRIRKEAINNSFKIGDIVMDKMFYNPKKQTYEGGNFYGRGFRLDCELRLINTNLIKVRVTKGVLHQVRFCTKVE